jgi:hypothetical protein
VPEVLRREFETSTWLIGRLEMLLVAAVVSGAVSLLRLDRSRNARNRYLPAVPPQAPRTIAGQMFCSSRGPRVTRLDRYCWVCVREFGLPSSSVRTRPLVKTEAQIASVEQGIARDVLSDPAERVRDISVAGILWNLHPKSLWLDMFNRWAGINSASDHTSRAPRVCLVILHDQHAL